MDLLYVVGNHMTGKMIGDNRDTFSHSLENSPIRLLIPKLKGIYLSSPKITSLVVRKQVVFFQSLILAQFRMILLTKVNTLSLFDF